MFKSISEYIFFLIPVAIVIGRIVSQARRKHAPPPERKISKPDIPVHFEDDDNDSDYYDEPGYLRGSDASSQTKAKSEPQKTFSASLFSPKADFSPLSPGAAIPKTAQTRESPPVTPGQEEFFLNLNHLSPMQQAVVMAEILGQPKGISPQG